MALKQQVYGAEDFYEIDLEDAPSLDLPHIVTDHVYMPKDRRSFMLFFVHLDKSYRPEGGCPTCHSKDLTRSGTTAPRKIHDVTRNNYRVDIILEPPRFFCKECKTRFVPEEIEGFSGRRSMTKRLEEYLRKECFVKSFTVLAEESGLSTQSIANIMDEELVKLDKVFAETPIIAPRVLGMDEKHISKTMCGTLVDVDTGKLIDMLPDNTRDTMTAAIKRLVDWDKNIEVVTVDMNNQYLSWLPELLPNATVVIDKFHVIKEINNAVKKSRTELIKSRKKKIAEIKDPVERARQSELLQIVTRNKRLFNYSMARLTREVNEEKRQRLATVIKEFPEFALLHNLHYTPEYMYEKTSFDEAEAVWQKWLSMLPPHGPKAYERWCDNHDVDPVCFEDFRRFNGPFYRNVAVYILNYFRSPDTRQTNAATEGLNSMIENVHILGKGYEFRHLRGKCLYAPLVHERLNYSVDMSTVKKLKTKFKNNSYFMTRYGNRLDEINIPDAFRYTTKYEFRSDTYEYCCPSLNVYSDNSWFAPILSAEHVQTAEMFMKAAEIGIMRGDVLRVEGIPTIEYDEESILKLPERLKTE